ncbi:hypothetical protein [Leeia aquatica]|nr:hypothetical protein [Leeia aquatica]
MMQRVLLLLLMLPMLAWAAQLQLDLGSLTGPQMQLTHLQASLDTERQQLRLQAAQLQFGQHQWRQLQLQCGRFVWQARELACLEGQLSFDGPPRKRVAGRVNLRYQPQSRSLQLTLSPQSGQQLSLHAAAGKGGWQGKLDLQQWPVTDALPWWPTELPKPSQGLLSAQLIWQQTSPRLDGKLSLRGVQFADSSGSRAGERVDLDWQGQLALNAEGGSWQGQLRWLAGEVYWEPFYLKLDASPLVLESRGQWQGQQLEVKQAQLQWAPLGQLDFDLLLQQGKLNRVRLEGKGLALKPLYETGLQPLLTSPLLKALQAEGRVDVSLLVQEGAPQRLTLGLHEVSLVDKGGKLGWYGVNGSLPWSRTEATTAALGWKGGVVLGLPLGAAELKLNLHGTSLSTPRFEQALLGGRLLLKDVSLKQQEDGWHGGLSGELTGVSLPEMSTALQWPRIEGELSGSLPRVVLSPKELRLFGPLEIQAFDGIAFLRNVRLQEPFGVAPRFSADLAMQNLDLLQLTRTFSFGAIEGRLDVNVDDLQLLNWELQQFDARIGSSPGDYRKRISQRAVENISALGGAGTAAALQRTFLRFFETFGYSQLGVSCRLRNNVCQMDGIATSPNGYVLVSGGGVPSINVIGYNRAVQWSELMQRLKRITAGGSAVVQ